MLRDREIDEVNPQFYCNCFKVRYSHTVISNRNSGSIIIAAPYQVRLFRQINIYSSCIFTIEALPTSSLELIVAP